MPQMCRKGRHLLTPDNIYTPKGTTWKCCQGCRRDWQTKHNAEAREALRLVRAIRSSTT